MGHHRPPRGAQRAERRGAHRAVRRRSAASTPTTPRPCSCSPARATRRSAPAATSRRWPTSQLDACRRRTSCRSSAATSTVDQADDRGGERRRLRRRLPARADVRPRASPPSTPRFADHRGEGRAGRAVGGAAAVAGAAAGRHGAAAHRRADRRRAAPTRSGWSTEVVPGRGPGARTAQELAETIAANAPLSVAAAKAMVHAVAETAAARPSTSPRRSGSRCT